MPIFVDYKKESIKYEVLGLNDYINGKDFKYIQILRDIVSATTVKFVSKSDGVFCNSVQKAKGFNTNIANFDINRCRGKFSEAIYSTMMRDFIIDCNNGLYQNRKVQFIDSHFDILGGWTKGEIVLMVPKNKRGWKS